MKHQQVIVSSLESRLLQVFGDKLTLCEASGGHAVAVAAPERATAIFKGLRQEKSLDFDVLLSITVVDWMDEINELSDERFEVVYHFLSLNFKHRFRLKVFVPEDKPEIDSACTFWKSANFMEREVWDMYGVAFLGHPDLRKILMYEEFKGHPLRKDYPLRGKQPRIQLRSPEVHNTAQDMVRNGLFSIKKKGKEKFEAFGSSNKSNDAHS